MYISEDILLRYYRGEATTEEKQLVEQWQQQQTESAQWVDLLMSTPNLEEPVSFDTDKAWTAIQKQIKSTNVVPMESRSSYRQLYRFAAAASLLLLATACVWYFLQTPATLSIHASAPMEVKLPDGSVVLLEEGASIQYPDEFNMDVRQVEMLSGKAFFSIVSNASHPFKIICDQADVQVIGTSFYVTQWDDSLQIDVVSGLVEVASHVSPFQLRLSPNESAIAYAKQLQRKALSLEAEEYNPPIGFYSFANTPIKKVIADLNEYYQGRILFSTTSDLDCPITAVFEREPIQDVLEQICMLCSGLEFEQQGNKFLLRASH